MKKTILLLLILFSTSSHSQTLIEILKAMSQTETNSKTPKIYFKNLTTEIVPLNSTSNARLSGGKNRQAVKVNLPVGTIKWYYRITLTPIESNFSYKPEQMFFSLLSNNHPPFVNNQTDYGIDTYLIDDFYIVNFLQTGNENYRYYKEYSREKTRGFIGECDSTKSNLWLGFKNNNLKDGLKAIVEIVAYGNF